MNDYSLYVVLLFQEYFQGQVKPVADVLTWNDTGDHLTKWFFTFLKLISIQYLFVLSCVEKYVRPTFVCVCFLRLLRASVLGLACKLGDKEALDSASQLFQQWLTGTVRWLFTMFSFLEDFKLWNKKWKFLKHFLFF